MKRKYVMVNAIKCPKCQDVIYSRAHHDFHSCTCQSITVDGGFEYVHYSWDPQMKRPKIFKKRIYATKQELYNDWNLMKDNFGLIKDGKHAKLKRAHTGRKI